MSRMSRDQHFISHDGESIFYRHWPSTAPTRGAIVLLHRGHEHSGRVAHLVDELDLPEFDFFAWDARGHGLSPGPRGYSPSWACSVQDLNSFVEHLRVAHEFAESDIYVIAQSVGAALAATWAHDYAPKVRGFSLASPAFKIKLYVPFARPLLALAHTLFGNFFVNSYVKPRFLTHDPERIESYRSDPLITRPISVNVLLGLHDAAQRVVQDAQAITQPVQLLISGSDFVVHKKPQLEFFRNLNSTVKEKHVLRGFYHDTLGEQQRRVALDQIRRFLLEQFSAEPSQPQLTLAHLQGFTFEESRRLAAPLPQWSPRRLYWRLTRVLLASLGKLSNGVRLGHDTGFDSGSTLDYVYRNQAAGGGWLGKLFDRAYLNSIGWRGIRQRKKNLEVMLQRAMELLASDNKSIRLMDIAAGHGRYVLDAVAGRAIQPASILLRDYSEINVQQGRSLIRTRKLADVASFVQADAFDRECLASVEPKPNLVVVSGLYELFADNDLVARSLAGIAAAIEPGGYLVYTGQPWHPQLEFIARALTSHREGQAWIMRRRSQAEMDQLVEAAGFHKRQQKIDQWGIFTVSLAQRI